MGRSISTRVMILLVVVLLSSRSSATLTDGLVAYYPFNGNANDESGTGNDGHVIGAATNDITLSEDRFGNPDSAYLFSEGYIWVPSSDSLKHFSGLIDDVRIYDRGLSEGEISMLFVPEPSQLLLTLLALALVGSSRKRSG